MAFNEPLPSEYQPASDPELELHRAPDIVIDSSSASVRYAVIELPSDESLRVIPWSAVSVDSTGRPMLNLTPAATHTLPYFHETAEMRRAYRGSHRSYVGAALAAVAIVLIAAFVYLAWRPASPVGREMPRVAAAMTTAAAVATETSADAAVTMKVKAALALSKRVRASDVSVDTEHRVTTLTGTVPTPEVREVAEEIAADTSGVRVVRNFLSVSGS